MVLRSRLLQLALHEPEPPLELALVVLEAEHPTAEPPELLAQASTSSPSTGSGVGRLGAAGASVPRRTVIFSNAGQDFSREVAGLSGRWTRARTSCPFLNVTGRDATSHSRSSSPMSASMKRSPMWIWFGKIESDLSSAVRRGVFGRVM